ncbi:MAG: protein kinase domain-containing protein [Nostoc sp. ZfuVER08]|nr:serine/threonine-protein kinase [Nostoc sp. ZfuVER08]
MSYCINPLCPQRQNPDDVENCLSCGTSLLINKRIRLIKPLRPLTDEPDVYFEIFEVDDAGTQWNPVRKRRVLKVLKWNSSKLRELIEREALSLQLIRHPYIPRSTIDDFFSFAPENSPLELRCLVMDKIDGQNLEEWLKSNVLVPQLLVLEWLNQLVEILDIVHRSNFFHRDIKPSNIILQPNGKLALIDFGVVRQVTSTYLAKVSGSGRTNTGRGGQYEITSVATPGYTPLEQIEGQAVPQSDFFSLGRTFVHLVTGTQPIDLPKDKKTGRLIWRDRATHIDKPLADFLDELMAPVPGQRPATTEVILQRLKILPRQSLIYKITRTKTFIFGVVIASASLIGLGIYKIGLPAYANNLVAQGQRLEAANNSEKAQSYFDKAVRVRPQLSIEISKFYFDKAARVKNDLNLEKKYYSLVIKYNPKDVDSNHNLAVACQLLQDIDCVTKAYNELFKLEPNIWEGHYNLGNFYESQDKYDLAEKEYRLAIKYSNNKATNAINNLARLKNLQEKYSEAVQLAIEGLKNTLDSDTQLKAALYKNLGWARLMQKDYFQADKNLQKAFELNSQRVDVYCLLAKTKEALGQLDYANSYWEMCLLARTEGEYLPEIQKWREEVLSRLFNKN